MPRGSSIHSLRRQTRRHCSKLVAMVRCIAPTKAGKQCNITSDTKMKDTSGRLVGLPLQLGGQYCLFHAKALCEIATAESHTQFVLFCIDLETDGLDTFCDNVVEIAALSANGATCSAMVKPPVDTHQLPTATAVHGISEAELQTGMSFEQCFKLWVEFLDGVANATLLVDSDSSQEPEVMPTLRFPTPQVLLAGHNGRAFDFPMLLCNCLRRGAAVEHLGRYAYVDTLDVCKAMSATSLAGGCLKLQCLVRGCPCLSSGLRAHRALDDCVALQHVTGHMASSLGIGEQELLGKFAFEIDLWQSCANARLYSQVAT